jgi:hypothetical protein
MWMLYVRPPAPNAPYWPGRQLLAVLDALAWPTALAIAVHAAPLVSGTLQSVLIALCALSAIRRCSRAIWRNEQYRFTTWQLAAPFAVLVGLGAVVKLAA